MTESACSATLPPYCGAFPDGLWASSNDSGGDPCATSCHSRTGLALAGKKAWLNGFTECSVLVYTTFYSTSTHDDPFWDCVSMLTPPPASLLRRCLTVSRQLDRLLLKLGLVRLGKRMISHISNLILISTKQVLADQCRHLVLIFDSISQAAPPTYTISSVRGAPISDQLPATRPRIRCGPTYYSK